MTTNSNLSDLLECTRRKAAVIIFFVNNLDVYVSPIANRLMLLPLINQ